MYTYLHPNRNSRTAKTVTPVNFLCVAAERQSAFWCRNKQKYISLMHILASFSVDALREVSFLGKHSKYARLKLFVFGGHESKLIRTDICTPWDPAVMRPGSAPSVYQLVAAVTMSDAVALVLLYLQCYSYAFKELISRNKSQALLRVSLRQTPKYCVKR